MKWGVRRYQKENGSLTPAGKKRYSENKDDKTTEKKEKVTHRMMLEKKYRDSGMSAEEAQKAADRRIKVERTLAITAGVTVGACAAYYAKNKWTETYCDQVLKSGTQFHNLDSVANARPGEHLYVNYRQNDTNYFKGHFAINKMRQTGEVFNHTLTATEDIKIPSLNTRKSVFKELYDNDDSFREAFNTHSGLPKGTKMSNLTYKSMWPRMGDKDNAEFNVAKRKYFEALRQKGYEAIVDEWDTNKRVFRSDAPLILLNTSSKSFGDMTIKELKAKDILLSQANARNYETGRDILTAFSLPHTNHFKESKGTLKRELAKNARNSNYIEKAIQEGLKTSKNTNTDDYVKNLALNSNGAKMADIGRYMTKNEKLTYSQAKAIANTKEAAKVTAQLTAMGTIPYATIAAPLIAINKRSENRYVRQYMEEHPNTTKTYNEIVTMFNKGEPIK